MLPKMRGGGVIDPPATQRPTALQGGKGVKVTISLRVDSDTISPIANIYLYTRNMYIQIEFQKKSGIQIGSQG